MEERIRIDKWLWSVRVFKTRNQATTACRAGQVKIAGIPVKPSREINVGEEISIHLKPVSKLIRVKGLIGHRVSAKLITDYMTDLTPEDEYRKFKEFRSMNFEHRMHGLGRPTKSDRRRIEYLKKFLGE